MPKRALSHLWPKASRPHFPTVEAWREGAKKEEGPLCLAVLICPGTELLRLPHLRRKS